MSDLPWKELARAYRTVNVALGRENDALHVAAGRLCSEDFDAGAAVAFGLMGMAEAIRKRDADRPAVTRKRKFPPAKVGDTFGARTVTALLPRDLTSNERVEWRCVCGRWGTAYVFNLRSNPRCAPCSRRAS